MRTSEQTNVLRIYSSKSHGNFRFIVFNVLAQNESRKRTKEKEEMVERTRKTMSGHGSMPAIFRARSHEKLTIRNLLSLDGSTFLVKIIFLHRNRLILPIYFSYTIHLFIYLCYKTKEI